MMMLLESGHTQTATFLLPTATNYRAPPPPPPLQNRMKQPVLQKPAIRWAEYAVMLPDDDMDSAAALKRAQDLEAKRLAAQDAEDANQAK